MRQHIGNHNFKILADSSIFFERIKECTEVLRDSRPNTTGHRPGNRANLDSSKHVFMSKSYTRCNDRFDSPLDKRLTNYKGSKQSRINEVIEKHINAARYHEQVVSFFTAEGGTPSISISRKKVGYRRRNYSVSYEAWLPSDWLKSGAEEVASKFDHTFIPLSCKAVPCRNDHRMYQVTRAMYRPKSGSEEVTVKVESGYAAFLNRAGKCSLTGWGKTPKDALKAVDKARGREARARLLTV